MLARHYEDWGETSSDSDSSDGTWLPMLEVLGLSASSSGDTAQGACQLPKTRAHLRRFKAKARAAKLANDPKRHKTSSGSGYNGPDAAAFCAVTAQGSNPMDEQLFRNGQPWPPPPPSTTSESDDQEGTIVYDPETKEMYIRAPRDIGPLDTTDSASEGEEAQFADALQGVVVRMADVACELCPHRTDEDQ